LQNRFEAEFVERDDYQFDKLFATIEDLPEW